MEELLKDSAENIIENNIEGIYDGPATVIPCNAAILVKPYDVNPYRKIDTTASGLIVGVESDKTYKSNETGEIEMSHEVVKCGKVLAVGDACKSVEVGDDVIIHNLFFLFHFLGEYIFHMSNIFMSSF